MYAITTFSAEETSLIGEKIARLLSAGDVLCVSGELGAGKTRLAQGVARGLGIREPVTSPTFILVNEHYGDIPFYHMDLYRLDDSCQINELGYEEYFFGDGVTLVEWSDRAGRHLPEARLDIIINRRIENDNMRELVLLPRGERYRNLVEELMVFVRAGN